MLNQYHSIFISPHIDDAVFSCGGTLARMCQEGRVLVIYVFSNYGKDTDQRKREEEKSAKRFGYDYEFLDLKDHSQRDWFGFLPFRRNRLMKEKRDRKWLHLICDRLKPRLQELEYGQIYFPLGVGFHIDHELCFHLGISRFNKGKTFFYEDIPYALTPCLLEEKIYYLGGKGLKIKGRKPVQNLYQEMNALLEYAGSRPAYAKIASKGIRRGLEYVSRHYFERRFKRLQNGPSPFSSVDLTPHFVCINDYFELKTQGIWGYESQVPLFFHSQEEMCKILHRYHWISDEKEAGLYERFWELKTLKSPNERFQEL